MDKLRILFEKMSFRLKHWLQRKKERFRSLEQFRKWPLYKKCFVITVVILFLISMLIFFGLEIQPTVLKGQERSQTLYLLSAVVQSLAAIGALVFTISLVIAQIASRFSLHVVKGIFDNYTLGYISLFIISILLLIWQLAETTTIIVKITLVLASACLIFLLPFFLFIREKIDISFQINQMVAESLKKLSNKKEEMPTEINTIESLIESSFANSDYDTLKTGVEALCKIALEFQANIKGDSIDPGNVIAREILTKLKDTSVNNIMDSRAPFIVVENYSNVARDGIKLKNDSIPEWSSVFLMHIALKATDEKLDDLIRWVVASLTNIGFYAIEENRASTGLSVSIKINEIIYQLFKCAMLTDASATLLSLGNLGKKAAEMKKESPAKEISEYIFEHSGQFWLRQMWNELAIHTIDQCEILGRAIREELWKVATHSIDFIPDNYIEAMIKGAKGFAFGLGNDLLVSGAWALIKEKDDYVEKLKGKNRKLESLIGGREFKNICVKSLELNKEDKNLKKAIENFIKA